MALANPSVSLPSIPPQSTPPLDDRGGDPNLPKIFAISWWRFFRELNTQFGELVQAVAGLTAGSGPAAGASAVTVQDATAVRILGVTYQNSGVTAMMVTITLSCLGGGGGNLAQADAITDSSATPTTVVASTHNSSTTVTVYQHLTFWVLPGSYYRITVNTPTVTLVSWVEWA